MARRGRILFTRSGWLVNVVLCLLCLVSPIYAEEPTAREFALTLTVTSELQYAHTPLDPEIDFAALLRDVGAKGTLDPNSIRVRNLNTGKIVPHALRETFAHADAGSVEWVIADPSHREYEIRFRAVSHRPAPQPAEYVPRIGTGDLLRYNAQEPRPLAPSYLSRLIDLNGDGRRDLLGCWNYAYRAGEPWDGMIAFPGVDAKDELHFGDFTRLHVAASLTAEKTGPLSSIYMRADFADFNGDGRVDVVYCPRRGNELRLYLDERRRDAGGWPIFIEAGRLDRQNAGWSPCRAVDLDQDGAFDFVVGNYFLRNNNPEGWPIRLEQAVEIDAGDQCCFFDIDEDGHLDAVCLADGPDDEPRAKRVAWRRNLGEAPPRFGAETLLPEFDLFWCSDLAAVNDGPRRGLLAQHDVYQRVSFFEFQPNQQTGALFRRAGLATSRSAVLALSDQAWPCLCDWDGDGDHDLLVGGGYGWPRIVINNGTDLRPKYAEAKRILADGKPIRLLRDEILGGQHWHNMGYSYPVFVDWDGDGLPDLILPNETNRVFWHKNVGTRAEPRFSQRRQILVDGYPDSPEAIAESARLAGDKSTPNQPYPYEKARPFFWRTGVAVADYNGDGLMDLVTHDGQTRKATLFEQYRNQSGDLRLRKAGPLKLADGRLIDDAIVGRASHWTESFRAVDWDGDGLLDLLYSCAGTRPELGSVYLLRNVGTKQSPLFSAPRTFCCFGKPIKVTNHGPHPWAADMNGDGRPDLLTCVEWSVYPYFSHAAIEMPQRPSYKLSPVQPR